VHLRSEDIVVLRAALALSLMEVPGVAKMSPKEAINRVQLSRAADEKLLISINVDLETNADLGEVKNRIKDFVRRVLLAYFDKELDYDIILEIENVIFETGRELLLQELLGYELGLTSQEDLWPRLKVALPKSDRVKRHIKRLLNAYLENRFAAYSDLEKMIMRLAVVETRFFGDEKMMPIIVSTWVDIARRYVDESFAKAIHAIMGTCYEEQNADTGLSKP